MSILNKIQNSIKVHRTKVVLEQGVDEAFQDPTCFQSIPEDLQARADEIADWVDNAEGEELEAIINRFSEYSFEHNFYL